MLTKGTSFWSVVFTDHKNSKEYAIKTGKIALYTSWWTFSRNFPYNLKWPEARIICSHAGFA